MISRYISYGLVLGCLAFGAIAFTVTSASAAVKMHRLPLEDGRTVIIQSGKAFMMSTAGVKRPLKYSGKYKLADGTMLVIKDGQPYQYIPEEIRLQRQREAWKSPQ